MSADYVKVYTGFFDGSLRDSPPYTRLLFLAMLSKADQNGLVHSTAGALAGFVNCSIEDVEEGLAILSRPDPSSTTPDEDGARISTWGDGANIWRITNYAKYYNKSRDEDRAEYKREWDRKNADSRHGSGSKRAKTRQNPTASDKPDKPDRERNGTEQNTKGKERKEIVHDPLTENVDSVMAYYNNLTGRQFSAGGGQASGIRARLRDDGASVEELKLIVDFKYNEWHDDDKMKRYLVPGTLFKPAHFELYLSDALLWDQSGRPAPTAPGQPTTMADQLQKVMENTG